LFSFSSVVKTAIKAEEKEIAKFIPRMGKWDGLFFYLYLKKKIVRP